jgi:hypothetical protein
MIERIIATRLPAIGDIKRAAAVMIARRMPVLPNDEVERRGNAATSIEAALSQSSTPSMAERG